MKRIISGLFLILIAWLGIFIPVSIAIPLSIDLKSWSGSRLWYLLLSPEFLDLKLFFICCIVVFILGLALVIIECFHKMR